jgi:uncharacterized protein (PEP-CTERM system associated)
MTIQPTPRGAVWLMAALAAPVAQAQDVPAMPGLTVQPTFTVQETITTNRDLSSSNAQADAITELRPGIRVSSRAGRVQGSLSYSLRALAYARASRLNTLQNDLNAALNAELIEKHAFLDASATASQQSISAFGLQGPAGSSGLNNGNQTEVYTLHLSPSLRGKLGDVADFSAALNWDASRSASSQTGDSTNHGGQVGLSSRRGLFGWALNASRQVSDYELGRRTTTDQAIAALSYFPRYDMQFTLRAGRERNDVLTGSPQSSTTAGFSAKWQPTERTNLALQSDKTYYGRSHNYLFTHRMARSVWSYTDTTSVSTPSAQTAARPLTLFDLLYNICLAGGGDNAGCDAAAHASLAQQGLNPDTVVAGGFLNASLTQQRHQNLAVSYAALRSTFTLSVFRSETSALGQVAAGSVDLAQGTPVRQQGFSLGVSQRLTPVSSLTLTGTQQTTLDSGALTGNRQRSVKLGWSATTGPRSTFALSARHTQFDSATNAYEESAVIGSLTLRF